MLAEVLSEALTVGVGESLSVALAEALAVELALVLTDALADVDAVADAESLGDAESLAAEVLLLPRPRIAAVSSAPLGRAEQAVVAIGGLPVCVAANASPAMLRPRNASPVSEPSAADLMIRALT